MPEQETEAAGMRREISSADRQRAWCVEMGVRLGINGPGKVLEPEIRTVPQVHRSGSGKYERELRRYDGT